MTRLAFLLVLGSGVLVSACGGRAGPPASPNVLILVMDTTRGDRCSVNGYSRPTTPRLEELAREGVAFRNAWSPAGWTTPAHASLFTGLRPEHHGLHRGNRSFLRQDTVTLAEQFAAAGYRTACFTNNDALAPEQGLTQGFEAYFPLFAIPNRKYPWASRTHREALEWAIGVQSEGGRFFLFINDMEPHHPYSPPEETAWRFLPRTADSAEVARARGVRAKDLYAHNLRCAEIPAGTLELISDLYDAEIACLDREIGTLIDGLRGAGLLDETVVIITSDHGENLGDHGLVDHMFSIHRSIRHVPLVVRYPPVFEAGRKVDDVVRLEDIAPTLQEICGLPFQDGLDGVSLLHDLPGRISQGLVDSPRAFLERMATELPVPFDPKPLLVDCAATFTGRFHLLRYSDGREEVYDVAADPLETEDLALR